MERFDGARDLVRAADALARRLPAGLRPLARLAYGYRWSWEPGGAGLFAAIDPHRWEICGENPVRLLEDASPGTLQQAADDDAFVAHARALANALDAETIEPVASGDPARPVAFLCTEFAVHRSLPIYSGGLGVLAGDILKEASDMRLPLAGVGLLYRQGYFRQRVDATGWQHEYWTDLDPDHLPAALVSGVDGRPLTVTVSLYGRRVTVQIWRVDVGRVPLFLLDAERPENDLVDRWITARLYVGDRRVRLAQYALLGLGGIRALRAMGFDPAVVHLNEGHAALAPLELVRASIQDGATFADALDEARARTIFTTHTPIGAGNESYTGAEVVEVLGDLPARLGVDEKDVLALGRAHPENADEPFGITPLGLRVSRAANGVSRLHGRVAREMWHHLYPERDVAGVPIGQVTNGVHLPSWMASPMRALLDRHLGEEWTRRAADPATWDALEAVPDEEVWAARARMRGDLISYARARAASDRLGRGEATGYVQAAARAFDPGVLTVGFARRVASYKRLYLLTFDPQRALRMLDGEGGLQLLIAGKPHPQDEEAKRIMQALLDLTWAPNVAQRVAFLEDYDLRMASFLVSGCDVWLNLPRPPLEASGTSGMKAALNGALNLSVLDGWWDEAFDGTNGWAIASHAGDDQRGQDARDAAALYDTLENEVMPLFYERDAQDVPRAWVRRIKSSMRSIGPRFCASRMLGDYRAIYGL